MSPDRAWNVYFTILCIQGMNIRNCVDDSNSLPNRIILQPCGEPRLPDVLAPKYHPEYKLLESKLRIVIEKCHHSNNNPNFSKRGLLAKDNVIAMAVTDIPYLSSNQTNLLIEIYNESKFRFCEKINNNSLKIIKHLKNGWICDLYLELIENHGN